eukprot:evm.model.NODE_33943_length_28332_cov_56.245975.4
MERAMIEVMPALDGIAVVPVVVIGVLGREGWGEVKDNSSECEGGRDVAVEGERMLPTSSTSLVAAEATVTGCLSLPVLVPSCVLEPIRDLEKSEHRFDFLRGGVETWEGTPSDGMVEDDDEVDDE